jgi:hypothetical protein
MQMERYVETHMPIEINPLSTKTISSIRDWITSCVDQKNSDHTRCFLSEKKFLPSRLIEIEQSDSGLQLRLVRSQDIDPEHHGGINYTTLSYCWGGNQPAKLIAQSLASYEQQIPWAIIPKTLQDAATTTNLLGIRYVWIDSLCIIQDDDDDKSREISQMAMVYSHSTLTIMARRGDKATDGFLHERSFPFGTTQFMFRSTESRRRGLVTLTFKSAIESENDMALNTRGWVMQEYLLSTRIVKFGDWNTEWSCRTVQDINDGGWPDGRQSENPLTYDEAE